MPLPHGRGDLRRPPERLHPPPRRARRSSRPRAAAPATPPRRPPPHPPPATPTPGLRLDPTPSRRAFRERSRSLRLKRLIDPPRRAPGGVGLFLFRHFPSPSTTSYTTDRLSPSSSATTPTAPTSVADVDSPSWLGRRARTTAEAAEVSAGVAGFRGGDRGGAVGARRGSSRRRSARARREVVARRRVGGVIPLDQNRARAPRTPRGTIPRRTTPRGKRPRRTPPSVSPSSSSSPSSDDVSQAFSSDPGPRAVSALDPLRLGRGVDGAGVSFGVERLRHRLDERRRRVFRRRSGNRNRAPRGPRGRRG